MKFIAELNSNLEKQKQNKEQYTQEQQNQDEMVYCNIYYPSIKIQCDCCKRDISRSIKILALNSTDYCVGCFAKLPSFPPSYRIINKINFSLFQSIWSAQEEILLLEALQKFGFGNWEQISNYIGSKCNEEVEEHYLQVYLNTPNLIPNAKIISKRDSLNMLIKIDKESENRKKTKNLYSLQDNGSASNHKKTEKNSSQSKRTVSSSKQKCKGSNPAEIVGYFPLRFQFEVEFDNDAELLIAEMEFNDDDSEQERQLKFQIIDIYNKKLTERIKRKQFVISRGLLDFKEQNRLDKLRDFDEREIRNMLKVFARFNTEKDHEALVQGIYQQKRIRERIAELNQYKKKGYKTLAQIEKAISDKEQKNEKKETWEVLPDKAKTRKMKKNYEQKQLTEKKICYLSKEEQELCEKFKISQKQYVMIKQTIIREGVRLGVIKVEDMVQDFTFDRHIIDAIFVFLEKKGDISTKGSKSK